MHGKAQNGKDFVTGYWRCQYTASLGYGHPSPSPPPIASAKPGCAHEAASRHRPAIFA